MDYNKLNVESFDSIFMLTLHFLKAKLSFELNKKMWLIVYKNQKYAIPIITKYFYLIYYSTN